MIGEGGGRVEQEGHIPPAINSGICPYTRGAAARVSSRIRATKVPRAASSKVSARNVRMTMSFLVSITVSSLFVLISVNATREIPAGRFSEIYG